MSDKPSITLSSRDFDRLDAMLRQAPDTAVLEGLRAELERATVVEPGDLPKGVVSMNSVVRLADVDDGEEMTLTLVYPRDAGKAGTVSVFAPVGSALLGLSVGQQIDWPMPGKHSRRLRVLEVEYQPEAAGDFHL